MKKRTKVIPIMLIILSCCAAIVMTLISTGYVCFLKSTNVSESSTETLEYFNKTHKWALIAYKLDPNIDNALTIMNLYDIYTYKTSLKTGEALPSDFCQTALRVSKEFMDRPFSENINKYYAIPHYLENDGELNQKSYAISTYAWALYMTGEEDQAKKEIEDFVYSLEGEKIKVIGSLYTFFNFVYNYPNNENDRAWVLEMENYMFLKNQFFIPDSDSASDTYVESMIEAWNREELG